MGKTLQAAFLFAGTIIGAGVLAIPSVIAKTGMLYGGIIMILIGLTTLVVSLMFGEVVLRTKDPHQLPGLTEKYSGKTLSNLAVIFSTLSIYGALIAYIQGCGLVLTQMFGLPLQFSKIIFFIPMALIAYFGLKGVEESESILTSIMIVCLVLISASALMFFDYSNVAAHDISNILLPIGVLVFAFEGLPAIPQMREVLEEEKKNLKKSILIGFSIPLILYGIFCFACIGALGSNIESVATLSLSQYGYSFNILGNVFALLAMSTGFISLANALRETYSEDLGMGKKISWVLSCFIPLIALSLVNFLMPSLNFAHIVAYTGVLFLGPYYLIAIHTFYKARKMGDRTPEYELKIPNYLTKFMMIAFFVFSIWAIYSTFIPIIQTMIL